MGIRSVVLLVLCAGALWTPSLSAQPSSSESRSAASRYEKGSISWGAAGGGALPVELLYARADRRMWHGALEVGRVINEEHGPGMLAGQFELLVQAMPVVGSGPTEFWGVGLTPVFLRWNFAGADRLRPFAELAAGFMLIDWKAPGPSTHTRNFNEQVGVGLRIGRGSHGGLVVGGRFQHISHGSRTQPSPGIDTYSVYVGFSSLGSR